MTLIDKRSLLVVLLVVTLSLAGSAEAATASPPASATAIVEITETDAKGKATTSRFETVVLRDSAGSRVEARSDASFTSIELDWQSDRSGAPAVLHLELKQEGERHRTRFGVRARVATGKRTVLSDFTRTDGSRFTLAATLR